MSYQPTGNPVGRPSSYSPGLAERICQRIASGENVKDICRDDDMPAVSTVTLWVVSDREGFSALYRRAREAWAYVRADELLDIADDSSGDTIETESGQRINSEFVQRSRLKVETRRWLMSKFAPSVFGDKQTVESTGPNGGPILNVQLVSYADPSTVPGKD